MYRPWHRIKRTLGASVLLGATVLGGAMAATPGGKEDDAFVGNVSEAFRQLGMQPDRAECYGRELLTHLRPANRGPAVALLRGARDASDVRRQVTAGGLDMIFGFRAANRSCPADLAG